MQLGWGTVCTLGYCTPFNLLLPVGTGHKKTSPYMLSFLYIGRATAKMWCMTSMPSICENRQNLVTDHAANMDNSVFRAYPSCVFTVCKAVVVYKQQVLSALLPPQML